MVAHCLNWHYFLSNQFPWDFLFYKLNKGFLNLSNFLLIKYYRNFNINWFSYQSFFPLNVRLFSIFSFNSDFLVNKWHLNNLVNYFGHLMNYGGSGYVNKSVLHNELFLENWNFSNDLHFLQNFLHTYDRHYFLHNLRVSYNFLNNPLHRNNLLNVAYHLNRFLYYIILHF